MPYFSWRGVTIAGAAKRGRSFARSEKLLDEWLFKRDIALLSCSQSHTWLLPAIRKATIISFFEQLAALLEAGVLLPEALVVIADHMHNIRFALVVEQVSDDIQQGHSFSTALERRGNIFDAMIVRLVEVGQEAGKVAVTVTALVAYLNSLQDFRKKIRSAAMGPIVSMIFFFVVFILIVFIMLPRLADILGTAHAQLPAMTRLLLGAGSAIGTWTIIAALCGIVVFFLVLRAWLHRPSSRRVRHWIALHTPFFSSMTIDTQMGWFFAASALLVRNGLSIVPALTIAKQTVNNRYLREEVTQVITHISSGCLVWNAMERGNEQYFLPEIVAMIQVGEQSGSLVPSFEKAAAFYHARALRMLTFITHVIQPLLLIIIGLLVALLIIAVYAPLFSISSTIG